MSTSKLASLTASILLAMALAAAAPAADAKPDFPGHAEDGRATPTTRTHNLRIDQTSQTVSEPGRSFAQVVTACQYLSESLQPETQGRSISLAKRFGARRRNG